MPASLVQSVSRLARRGCPLHKAKFDLATGQIERDPKLLFLNMKAKSNLAVYPVRIEGEDILVGV
jgi:nitrite reductase/ring-hydroxylating ferredoxin subunit